MCWRKNHTELLLRLKEVPKFPSDMNLPHAVAGGNVNGSIPTNFSLAMTEVRNTKAFRAGKHINHEILQSSGSRTQIYWLPKIPELNICGCYHQSKPDNDQHNCSWSMLPCHFSRGHPSAPSLAAGQGAFSWKAGCAVTGSSRTGTGSKS